MSIWDVKCRPIPCLSASKKNEQREKKTRMPVKPATRSKNVFSLHISMTPLSPRAASCALPEEDHPALVNAVLLQDQQHHRIDAWLWLGCQSRAAPTQIQAALSWRPHPER